MRSLRRVEKRLAITAWLWLCGVGGWLNLFMIDSLFHRPTFSPIWAWLGFVVLNALITAAWLVRGGRVIPASFALLLVLGLLPPLLVLLYAPATAMLLIASLESENVPSPHLKDARGFDDARQREQERSRARKSD